jgi:hypothetical protein
MPLTPAAPAAKLREHIKLSEQTAKLFAEGQNHPAKKTAAEMSLETTPLQLARWHKIVLVIILDAGRELFPIRFQTIVREPWL